MFSNAHFLNIGPEVKQVFSIMFCEISIYFDVNATYSFPYSLA
jgi:hypothetical protein